MKSNKDINPDEKQRLENRSKFVKKFIDAGARKGVTTTNSVRKLANNVLFISRRQVYNDWKRARNNDY